MTGYSGGAMPLIDDKSKANVRSSVRQIDDRIEALSKSKEEVGSKLKDELAVIYQQMSDLIANAMFSYTAQREGFAPAHEEVRRLTSPEIPVNNDIIRWFKKANVVLPGKDRKTNRKNLEIAWKILGHYIGEATNTETLRPRDNYTGRPVKADVLAEQGS